MDGGRVLKAGQGAEARPRRRLSAAEWMGAEQAEALVASAEAEAEAVRQAAAQDRAAAREEGRAEGLRAASGQVAERLAELAEAQERWLARAEREALDLAVEMARRIVDRELRSDPAAAGHGALLALRAAGRRRALRVRLHPDTVAELRRRAPALAQATAGASLELAGDPALQPGDVVVESEAGVVDGRIATRLEAFRAALAQDPA
jgi:flagellar biosynthesis/type III secretory pathway protein FliH